MNSFIDLMGNEVWTDADITRRTESMVHSVVPAAEELILMRKSMAASMGQWTLTVEEQMQIGAYSIACNAAHQVGIQMRADNVLLADVLTYESALDRLALPLVTEPEMVDVTDQEGVETTVPNPAIAADTAERVAAQAVIDGATQATLDLYLLRHPVAPEPEVVDVLLD